MMDVLVSPGGRASDSRRLLFSALHRQQAQQIFSHVQHDRDSAEEAACFETSQSSESAPAGMARHV